MIGQESEKSHKNVGAIREPLPMWGAPAHYNSTVRYSLPSRNVPKHHDSTIRYPLPMRAVPAIAMMRCAETVVMHVRFEGSNGFLHET